MLACSTPDRCDRPLLGFLSEASCRRRATGRCYPMISRSRRTGPTATEGCRPSCSFLLSSSESEVLITVPPSWRSAAIAFQGVACFDHHEQRRGAGLQVVAHLRPGALSSRFSPKWPNKAPIPAAIANSANGIKINSPNNPSKAAHFTRSQERGRRNPSSLSPTPRLCSPSWLQATA